MATIELQKPVKTDVTGSIRLITGSDSVVLYMSATEGAKSDTPTVYGFDTVLAPLQFNGANVADPTASIDSSWPTIKAPQLLPPPPDWDLQRNSEGGFSAVVQSFGGAWNSLYAGDVTDDVLAPQLIFDEVDCSNPRFVRGGSGTALKTPIATMIEGGATLVLFQPPSGTDTGQSPETTILTPASAGVAFADDDSSTDSDVMQVVYKTDQDVGPLSPSGLFLGSVTTAEFSLSNNKITNTLPIIQDKSVYEFDAAACGNDFCLFASSGAAPLLVRFTADGKPEYLSWPESWTRASAWISSPTIVALPPRDSTETNGGENGTSSSPAFLFAYIEHDGDIIVGVRVGSISLPLSPTTNGSGEPQVPPAA